jgi:hypothetical protein
MKTIRQNTFETNSSSCHVITVLTDSELEMLQKGELLLLVYRSQGDKVLTKSLPQWRFRYEIQECQSCYDYETGERKWVDIERPIIDALSEVLWALLIENTKTPVENFENKLNDIFDMFNLDVSFITAVKDFIRYIEGSSFVHMVTENMVKYGSGYDQMNFSCHEVEC